MFGENATEPIRDVSVLQRFEGEVSDFDFHVGDEVRFGEQVYEVAYAGGNVGMTFRELGHVTFVFDAFNPEHFIETSVYLMPHTFPTLEEGMTINYVSKSQGA